MVLVDADCTVLGLQCLASEGEMKQSYEKPSIETEAGFETLAAGCTIYDRLQQMECEEPPLLATP